MTSWYERNKERILRERKEKYHSDSTFRAENAIRGKEWRIANPEKMRAYRKKWEEGQPAWVMYHNAKRRAKEFGIPFTITLEDLKIPEKCPVFDVSFDYDNRELSPSLDRLIPTDGYTANNIRVISMRANRIKSDGTADEHQRITNYMSRQ